MKFGAIADALDGQGIDSECRGPIDTMISDVVHDSRQASPGALFCAVPGAQADGHDFAANAIDGGASALLVERWLDVAVPQLRVDDARRAMAPVAATVHRHPSAELAVFGITGTNGKTTTVQLLADIIRHAGKRVETVGTLSGKLTTPEATDWQRDLRRLADDGVDVVAAEVSSHALDQGRVDSTSFAAAAFTNLTTDHLDYHGDMAGYFAAKQLLFDGRAREELINVDDPWGVELAARRPNARRISIVDLPVVSATLDGTTISWRGADLAIPLPGQMNVANGVMAAEAALILGVDDTHVRAGLAAATEVRGRMERIDGPEDGPTVIVDYSHTPDSIDKAIATLREVSPADATIGIAFGSAGDRDRTKRPLMARAAEAADIVVVTSDNPRTEDPELIIDEVVAGLAAPTKAIIEADRRVAIRRVIEAVGSNGIALIAGKGHEDYQEIGRERFPFDDAEVARLALQELYS